ncbi:MAG TPA: signal peptide peptidase SppA [Methanolinea sp.]|nr:signal peptide peptidase SppA [Methanolinea sp.]HQK56268.1 signal peptide peptidase SppA [Methanolinea sp.]
MQAPLADERKGRRRNLALLILVLAGAMLCAAGLFLLFTMYAKDLGISVVRVEGTIVTGNFRGDGYVGSEYVGRMIREAADDPLVEAIVIRINSPGGTPSAAQEIARDIRYAREKKPVVVSMGDMATSAAYYVSAYADRIYANPDSLTGGIGTSWTFLDISGWLEEKNLSVQVVKSGSMKDMGSNHRPLTSVEREYAQAVVDQSNERFIADILAERRLNRSEIDDGRLIRGEQALLLGMVDELGNLNDAIAGARNLTG